MIEFDLDFKPQGVGKLLNGKAVKYKGLSLA